MPSPVSRSLKLYFLRHKAFLKNIKTLKHYERLKRLRLRDKEFRLNSNYVESFLYLLHVYTENCLEFVKRQCLEILLQKKGYTPVFAMK